MKSNGWWIAAGLLALALIFKTAGDASAGGRR